MPGGLCGDPLTIPYIIMCILTMVSGLALIPICYTLNIMKIKDLFIKSISRFLIVLHIFLVFILSLMVFEGDLERMACYFLLIIPIFPLLFFTTNIITKSLYKKPACEDQYLIPKSILFLIFMATEILLIINPYIISLCENSVRSLMFLVNPKSNIVRDSYPMITLINIIFAISIPIALYKFKIKTIRDICINPILSIIMLLKLYLLINWAGYSGYLLNYSKYRYIPFKMWYMFFIFFFPTFYIFSWATSLYIFKPKDNIKDIFIKGFKNIHTQLLAICLIIILLFPYVLRLLM